MVNEIGLNVETKDTCAKSLRVMGKDRGKHSIYSGQMQYVQPGIFTTYTRRHPFPSPCGHLVVGSMHGT